MVTGCRGGCGSGGALGARPLCAWGLGAVFSTMAAFPDHLPDQRDRFPVAWTAVALLSIRADRVGRLRRSRPAGRVHHLVDVQRAERAGHRVPVRARLTDVRHRHAVGMHGCRLGDAVFPAQPHQALAYPMTILLVALGSGHGCAASVRRPASAGWTSWLMHSGHQRGGPVSSQACSSRHRRAARSRCSAPDSAADSRRTPASPFGPPTCRRPEDPPRWAGRTPPSRSSCRSAHVSGYALG